ncbi:MAG TPA: hypothetical protein VLC09_06275, partial [Polyangiaceae bacterium]|nr:hypothetical protein [Polyangiaceae bacterium]
MKPSRYETLAIGLGWLLSLLAGWLATRPGLELLHSLGSSEAAAFDAGGLELLELAHVEQPSALAAARRGIQWLAGATLLSLLPRALLCRAVMSEPASWGSWLRESLVLLPRFVVQRLVVLCGGAVLVGLGLWFIDGQATLVGWVEGAPLLFAALAFCLAQPFAALVDGWNLTLARDARLIAGARAAYQLVGDRRSWWMRAGKSVSVGVLAALGLEIGRA